MNKLWDFQGRKFTYVTVRRHTLVGGVIVGGRSGGDWGRVGSDAVVIVVVVIVVLVVDVGRTVGTDAFEHNRLW